MFLISGIISVIFFIAKFLEMRNLYDSPKPLKYLIRDTLLVYFSVLFGMFILDQLKPIMNETKNISVPAFTGDPNF
jgi:hypothetical protein